MKEKVIIRLFGALALLLALPSYSQQICDEFGTLSVAGGEYTLQNNIWGASTPQCISPVGSTGFRVDSSGHNLATNGNPAAYPSIYKGCHWEDCTPNSGAPIQVSQISRANFSWSFSTISSGAWNATAEAWFKQTSTPGAPDGAELMLWFDSRGGVQPGGSRIGTANIGGATWEVWMVNIGWNFVTYRRTSPVSSANIDLIPFMNDAISRGFLSPNWYLMDMEAGFELWQGGAGLTSNSFSFSVSGGGGSSSSSSSSRPAAAHLLRAVRPAHRQAAVAASSATGGARCTRCARTHKAAGVGKTAKAVFHGAHVKTISPCLRMV